MPLQRRGAVNSSFRSRVRSLLLPSTLLLAVPAVAQADSSGAGFTLGLRGGYGVPVGDAFENAPLNDRFEGAIAPQIDVGYFLNRNVSLGIYGQVGFAQVNPDLCPVTIDCEGRVLRFGVDVNYHVTTTGALSPWLGLGVGYEIAEFEASSGDIRGSSSMRGMELVHLQGGLDFRLSSQVWLGPYAVATVGQYSRASARLGWSEVSEDIEDKALHFWLQPGLRLQVRL
nr:outer membrane beta-barrel protein [Corallococcus macrosporus]